MAGPFTKPNNCGFLSVRVSDLIGHSAWWMVCRIY